MSLSKEQLIEVTNNVRMLIQESPTSYPERLSQILVELTSLRATLSEEYRDTAILRPERKRDLRSQYKTVAETNWAYEASPEGKKEAWLKGWLDDIKDVKASIKARLQTLHDDAYGQY